MNHRDERRAYWRQKRASSTTKAWVRTQRIAHLAVNYAVKAGAIIKPATCECCRTPPVVRLEGHHFLGYTGIRALRVVWLNSDCHKAQHRLVLALRPLASVLSARA